MSYRNSVRGNIKDIQTKLTSVLLGTIGIAGIAMAIAMPVGVRADSSVINFEPPTYTIGNINGQDGWIKTGAFDSEVSANTSGFSSFGSQSLRLSDAVTSGSFGDQTFAKPLGDAVGEAGSTNGTFLPGTLQRFFDMQFDIASATPGTQQSGMHTSVSPDRGDGSRMSYLRFEDNASGIDVFFDDVQGTSNPANFVETKITTLNRSAPHTVRLVLNTLDGSSNDIVKVWIDGVLIHTGTSWENYYRFDSESAAEQSPRIVKTVLFRESGDAHTANAQKGFLFDNLSMQSSTPASVVSPANADQCKNNGWKTFNNPVFKNQGDCVSWVQHNVRGNGTPAANR